MELIYFIIVCLLSSTAVTLDPEESTSSRLSIYSLPKQNSEFTTWKESHDILKAPLVVFTRDDAANEFEGYYAKKGLSSIVSDPLAKDVFESLKTDDIALLLNPQSMTEADWNTLENSPFDVNGRSLVTLAILLASYFGIPWLLGSSSQNSTTSANSTSKPPTTSTYKYGPLHMLYALEITDSEIRVLENLHELPSSLEEEP